MSDQPSVVQEQDENHIIAERRAKLAEWRATGKAYPNDFERENISGKIVELYDEKTGEELEANPVEVKVAGRIMLKRVMGKASFITIADVGGRIQLYVARDKVGDDVYAAFKRWDIGDIVGAVGTLFRTRTNELTVQCVELRLLSKSLRPLPEKFHGLSDQEQKYRLRHLDLIMSAQSRFPFLAPSPAVQNASQRAGYGTLPAHRAGAVPQETRGRWLREGLRTQSQLP